MSGKSKNPDVDTFTKYSIEARYKFVGIVIAFAAKGKFLTCGIQSLIVYGMGPVLKYSWPLVNCRIETKRDIIAHSEPFIRLPDRSSPQQSC